MTKLALSRESQVQYLIGDYSKAMRIILGNIAFE